MKKFNRWYESLSTEDVRWYMTIFTTALLGTLVSSLVLKWGMYSFGELGATARLAVSLAATTAYAAVIVVVFYILLPDARLAFKRIWVGKK